MKIVIGADHLGFPLKAEIFSPLTENEIPLIDSGIASSVGQADDPVINDPYEGPRETINGYVRAFPSPLDLDVDGKQIRLRFQRHEVLTVCVIP